MNSNLTTARSSTTSYYNYSDKKITSQEIIENDPKKTFTNTEEDYVSDLTRKNSDKDILSAVEKSAFRVFPATNITEEDSDIPTVIGSNIKVDFQYLPDAESSRFHEYCDRIQRAKSSQTLTTNTKEKLAHSNEEVTSAMNFKGENEDNKSSDISSDRRLNIDSDDYEERHKKQRKFAVHEKSNENTVIQDGNNTFSKQTDFVQSSLYESAQRQCGMKKVFTIVRPNPQRPLGSDSTLYSPMSNTRKLALIAKNDLRNKPTASEPDLKDFESSELSTKEVGLRNAGSLGFRRGRIFEGGRFLFCNISSWKKSEDSLLIPRESLCCESEQQDNLPHENIFKAQNADVKMLAAVAMKSTPEDNDKNESFEKDYNQPNKRKINKQKVQDSKALLERQQAFDEESCYDYVNMNDTLNLLNPIVGIINGNVAREASPKQMDICTLKNDDNETQEARRLGIQSSKESISHAIEWNAGGIQLRQHWQTRNNEEKMVNSEEKERTYQTTQSLDAASDNRVKFNKGSKTMSISYPCLRRERKSCMETQHQGNEETDCLLSKNNEGNLKLYNKETKAFVRENVHFKGSSKNTLKVVQNSERINETSENVRCLEISSNRPPDIVNNIINNPLTAGKRMYSLSEPMLGTRRRQPVSASVLPEQNVKPINVATDVEKPHENPDIFTSGDLSPKKRNRVKLALATSHAGIYVTGDSQESSDSPIGCSFERCPSWIGNQSNCSPFLSPYYQPSTSSNDEKDENPIISVQKRKISPISLSSTRQKSNSSDKDSGTSWSPHSKTSGFSVQDSGFEASGRHSTALLSPSFRKMTLPMTSHPGTSTSGEMYSSDEYFAYNSEKGSLSPTLSIETKRERRRKVGIGSDGKGPNAPSLLSPTFKARSYEETEHRFPKPQSHLYRSSNSTEGDSGLETPRSNPSQSPRSQRDRISIQSTHSSRGPQERSSRFSVQSKLSSKSSVKSGGSFKGSFLSFLSPKNLFGSRRGSDGRKSSCGSKSSRKQLADFPDDEKILVINVSGRKFKLHEYFTTVYPETLLGNVNRNEYYDSKKEEFFFDRDPDIFRHIWNFYYTGKLHFPKDECVSHFVDEITFFGVADEYLCTCCWEDEFEPAVEKLEKLRSEKQMREQEMLNKTRKIPRDATLREKIWLTTKDPIISTKAKIFYFFSMLAIVVSTVASITETIPCSRTLQVCKENNQELYFYIDSGCVAFFTMEYLLRLLSAPKRLHFMRKFMSVIDLLAILPYYCDMLLRQIFEPSFVSGINLLEILRTLRIVRVFKLLKHSRRLQSLVHTFKSSTTELGLIVFIYLVLVTVFASVIYYAEVQDNPKYSSIPESMWYAVITTTTTGYGDIVPETIIGKLIGCACCLLGVLIVALPVPILQIR